MGKKKSPRNSRRREKPDRAKKGPRGGQPVIAVQAAAESPAPGIFIPRLAVPEIGWPAVAAPADAIVLTLNHQFEQSQWWSAPVIEALQMRQAERLLAHAREAAPFHRDRLAAFAAPEPGRLTMDEWRRIPPMTRADIQDAGKGLLSQSVPESHGKAADVSTSGSTGQPVTIKSNLITGLFFAALNLRYHIWHGRDFSAKVANIHRLHHPEDAEKPRNWVPGYASGPMVELDIRSSIERQLTWLTEVKADYLLTHPTNLQALLERSEKTGAKPPGLSGVSTFSEVLEPEIRATCERVWGLAVVDAYSAFEVGMIALQCPKHPHYHVQSESVLLEILDAEGKPCPPGRIGRVVLTDLHNFAMPLIRYEIGDYAEAGESCSCGRGLPVIKRILGRARNRLTLPSGEKIWAGYADALEKFPAPVRQTRLIQRNLQEIEVRLVVARPLTPLEEEQVRTALGEALGRVFAYPLIYVDEIPRSRSGKLEVFTSELDA